MYAIVNKDIVTGRIAGNSLGINIPADLRAIDIKRLRWNGNEILDIELLTDFFIDRSGGKHIIQHDAAWQPLSCVFDAELINDAGVWRVKTDADKFAEIKKIKLAEINRKSSAALASITSNYTREEMDSWPTQEAEAKAYQTDNLAATPLIDGIVSNRTSKTKADMVNQIIANAAAYKATAGGIIGKKQHYVDQLEALDPATATQADIDGVIVSY